MKTDGSAEVALLAAIVEQARADALGKAGPRDRASALEFFRVTGIPVVPDGYEPLSRVAREARVPMREARLLVKAAGVKRRRYGVEVYVNTHALLRAARRMGGLE